MSGEELVTGNAPRQSQTTARPELPAARPHKQPLGCCMSCKRRSPFFIFIEEGDTYEVERFLREDPLWLRHTDKRDKRTAWHVAAERGKTEVLRVLAARAREDDVGQLWSTLYAPSFNSRIRAISREAPGPDERVVEMVNSRSGWGITPLALAAQADHAEAVRYLITLGADPWVGDHEGRNPAHYAAKAGAVRGLQVLCEEDRPYSSRACNHNRPSTRYIDSLDCFGFTPLHYATWANKRSAMMVLIGFDANIIARSLLLHTEFYNLPAGSTPLHVACLMGDLDRVKLLLRAYYETAADLLPSQTALLGTAERRRRARSHPDPRLILTRTQRLPFHVAARSGHRHLLDWLDPSVPLMFLFGGEEDGAAGPDGSRGSGTMALVGVSRLTVIAAKALHQALVDSLDMAADDMKRHESAEAARREARQRRREERRTAREAEAAAQSLKQGKEPPPDGLRGKIRHFMKRGSGKRPTTGRAAAAPGAGAAAVGTAETADAAGGDDPSGGGGWRPWRIRGRRGVRRKGPPAAAAGAPLAASTGVAARGGDGDGVGDGEPAAPPSPPRSPMARSRRRGTGIRGGARAAAAATAAAAPQQPSASASAAGGGSLSDSDGSSSTCISTNGGRGGGECGAEERRRQGAKSPEPPALAPTISPISSLRRRVPAEGTAAGAGPQAAGTTSAPQLPRSQRTSYTGGGGGGGGEGPSGDGGGGGAASSLTRSVLQRLYPASLRRRVSRDPGASRIESAELMGRLSRAGITIPEGPDEAVAFFSPGREPRYNMPTQIVLPSAASAAGMTAAASAAPALNPAAATVTETSATPCRDSRPGPRPPSGGGAGSSGGRASLEGGGRVDSRSSQAAAATAAAPAPIAGSCGAADVAVAAGGGVSGGGTVPPCAAASVSTRLTELFRPSDSDSEDGRDGGGGGGGGVERASGSARETDARAAPGSRVVRTADGDEAASGSTPAAGAAAVAVPPAARGQEDQQGGGDAEARTSASSVAQEAAPCNGVGTSTSGTAAGPGPPLVGALLRSADSGPPSPAGGRDTPPLPGTATSPHSPGSGDPPVHPSPASPEAAVLQLQQHQQQQQQPASAPACGRRGAVGTSGGSGGGGTGRESRSGASQPDPDGRPVASLTSLPVLGDHPGQPEEGQGQEGQGEEGQGEEGEAATAADADESAGWRLSEGISRVGAGARELLSQLRNTLRRTGAQHTAQVLPAPPNTSQPARQGRRQPPSEPQPPEPASNTAFTRTFSGDFLLVDRASPNGPLTTAAAAASAAPGSAPTSPRRQPHHRSGPGLLVHGPDGAPRGIRVGSAHRHRLSYLGRSSAASSMDGYMPSSPVGGASPAAPSAAAATAGSSIAATAGGGSAGWRRSRPFAAAFARRSNHCPARLAVAASASRGSAGGERSEGGGEEERADGGNDPVDRSSPAGVQDPGRGGVAAATATAAAAPHPGKEPDASPGSTPVVRLNDCASSFSSTSTTASEALLRPGGGGGEARGAGSGDEDDVCPVCLDERPNLVVQTCRHQICMDCARDLVKRNNLTPALCPYCRGIISGFKARVVVEAATAAAAAAAGVGGAAAVLGE